MAKTLFSVALLATAALAAPRPDVEVVQVRQVEKRQESSMDLSDLIPTSIDLGSLSSLLPTDVAIPTDLDLSSILGGIATLLPSGCMPPSELASAPTPPADVRSALLSYTDACNEPSFTGDVGKHYTSWSSEAEAWASSNGPALTSWLSAFETACPYATADGTGAAGISSLLASYSPDIPSCSTGTGAKPTGSNTAKQTGPSESKSGAAQSGSNTGAAPQQTAFAAAAGVIAGFAGMVAYL